ncbi:hypothetical protein CERSUDRAFT_117144 [Gelatoporia subvermispora B]|uniref:Uncharacterized protein n=1 Tax=Ceriporiopsis subvermispora (strain B) TaxID=914234 RepID=M2R793_CERS8|nr:hypothetical protein CERSUDRAFT_117144 [Gelatoporia subvermispora B]
MEAVPEEIELVEVIPDSENERAHLEMLQESAAPAMEAAPPAGETYEDEADVEGMLAVAESAPQSGARSVVTQPSPAVRHSPQDELDSDDQRVERSLFVSPSVHSSARRVPHSTSGIVQRGLSDDAADAADELNQSMMANLSDHSFAHLPRLSLSGQPHPSASADRSHRRVSAPIAPSASGLLQHTAPTSPASRPSPAGHIPEDSSNSEFETVPMLGTRARAEKQRLKEETLRREWTPPPGTRASRMVTRSGAVFGRR